MRSWKVIDFGRPQSEFRTKVEFACQGCGKDSLLPVCGLPIAEFKGGIVFDPGSHAIPAVVQCPHCRRRFGVA